MHHQQAVEMTALIPSHTENKDVRTLGAKISLSQTDEIKFMERWLRARGQPISMAMPGMPDMDMHGNAMKPMPGMLTPEQMSALRAAKGAEFDRLFLTGMIQHHNGALVMVKELFDTAGAGQDADIFDFATDVDNTQRAEIRIMQGMLQNKLNDLRIQENIMNGKHSLPFRLASAAFAASLLFSGVARLHAQTPAAPAAPAAKPAAARRRPICSATRPAAATGDDRFVDQRPALRIEARPL